MQIEKIKTKYNQILTQYIKGDITNVGLVSFLLSFTKQYLGYEEEKYIDKYDIIGDLFALYEHYSVLKGDAEFKEIYSLKESIRKSI